MQIATILQSCFAHHVTPEHGSGKYSVSERAQGWNCTKGAIASGSKNARNRSNEDSEA
jgi:hypothetical protein